MISLFLALTLIADPWLRRWSFDRPSKVADGERRGRAGYSLGGECISDTGVRFFSFGRRGRYGPTITVIAPILSACVSQAQYDAMQAQNQQLKALVAALQAEQKYVEAADLLFPEGGYQLSPAGRAELANNIVPKLRGLQNAKVVVYGYTDNLPVGPALQGQGIPDNLALSARRAATVVSFLVSQGVNPDIISAKGVGDTRPVAPNDTPQSRAQNRRIEITVQGPGGIATRERTEVTFRDFLRPGQNEPDNLGLYSYLLFGSPGYSDFERKAAAIRAYLTDFEHLY